MPDHMRRRAAAAAAPVCFAFVVSLGVGCLAETVEWDSDRWERSRAQVIEHMGRQALMGVAYLEDVEFQNGLIEVDIAMTGARSYPGIQFRMMNETTYEECYIRPHRAGLYPDALQYTPVTHGISSWQLYNGEGYTSGVEIDRAGWNHLKIAILGSQARVYVGDAAEPALVIDRLEHGVSTGGIGVSGPMDGSAYFSNFAYEVTNDLEFVPPVSPEVAPGTIMAWELSGSFPISALDPGSYPFKQDLGDIEWTKVAPAPSGLVDVARFMGRTTREPECVLARAILTADEAGPVELAFGYSDWVGIFLNGDLFFQGGSGYQSRDPSFLGIVGLFDSVFLPLKRGENELLLLVAESFGGWGFMCRDATAVFEHPSISKAWETGKEFKVPESVAYDPAAGVLYVSNYDMYAAGGGDAAQYISRVSLGGEILDSAWATGLRNPTGMAVVGDRLFVVERGGLAEIDTRSGDIVARHAASGQGFLNDAAADAAGNIYVSDSRSGALYRLGAAGLEVWLKSDAISQPNGLHVHENLLLVGNSGDECLKAVDLATGEISTVARMGPGIIDGIGSDADGNYIVSHWEGRVYGVSPAGERLRLLDLTGPQQNCADLACVPDAGLIVIPGFTGNRVVAYRLDD